MQERRNSLFDIARAELRDVVDVVAGVDAAGNRLTPLERGVTATLFALPIIPTRWVRGAAVELVEGAIDRVDDIPSCFLAGTPVLMRQDFEAPERSVASSDSEELDDEHRHSLRAVGACILCLSIGVHLMYSMKRNRHPDGVSTLRPKLNFDSLS